VRRARTPAYALLATGGAMLAAGVPLLVTGAADQAQGASALDAVNARLDLCGREPGRAGCTVNGNPIRTADLAPEASAAAAQRDDGGVRAVVGGVLTGLGVAGAVTGVVLFLRSGSLGGFDRPAGWSFELRRDGLGLRAVF